MSATFADGDSVFASMPGQIPGVSGVLFRRIDYWQGDCFRRPAKLAPSQWRCVLPDDPVWNLWIREVLFCMLNPTHRSLRDAGIFLASDKWSMSSAILTSVYLRDLSRWAIKENMPHDLRTWSIEDWQGFLNHKASTSKAVTIAAIVNAVRKLFYFSPLLTDLGVINDPWPGRSAIDIAKAAVSGDLATGAIPPEVWWPLLRAAWAYLDRFAPGILDRRAQAAEQQSERAKKIVPALQNIDQMLDEWLADTSNMVPVSNFDSKWNSRGTPVWIALSRAVSDGRNPVMFATNNALGEPRRQRVLQMIAETGRVRFVSPLRSSGRNTRFVKAGRRSADFLDATLRAWLEDPTNLIPIYPTDAALGTPGGIAWRFLESAVYETPGQTIGLSLQSRGKRRREWVRQAAAEEGRTFLYQDEPLSNLRMLRAACYIFLIALTAMRDSEVQEIGRGALTQSYGAPAITSRKSKHDSSQPQANWWIIEPAAQAIAVAERLSWHPTHIFSSLMPPVEGGVTRQGRAGFKADDDIDFFIATVNANRHSTGLEEIPSARVRPHMFRRTMSIIASQEPDGDIALGIQLKHAARRARANSLTGAYGKLDAKWAKEFDKQLETAAARKLVALLNGRRRGETIAVGPGAARFHAGLDKVIGTIDSDPTLRAQIADERLVVTLLRDEFANLHLGTVNHCLWNASTAECQNQLPEDRRGKEPILGACQPAHCRNSVLTPTHERIWRMEEDDLVNLLKKKISKPLRAQAEGRLAEVRSVNAQFDKLRKEER